jgi:hypothetical protein
LPVHPKGTLHLRLGFRERQCPYRADLDTQRPSLSTGAQVAFEIPVPGLVVKNSAVWATVGAGSASYARIVVEDRDSIVVER